MRVNKMSNTTYYNLDKAIFGYDVDLKVNQRKDGKSWFTFLDGRVGQESEIEKGISDLLTSIVEANKAVNGMGFVNDFDYMLAREMSERPDLLIRDKPKVDKALKNRLRDVMPGVENLGDEVDVGLLLTAYSKIAFDHGRS